MKQAMFGRQSGFTLVEIAIVLVIVGLLIGGVLKGQELINQAKIRNLVNDVNGVAAAVHGYQDRYRKLPGDDDQAQSRWAADTNILSGNGNGVVEGCYNASATCTAGVTTGGVTTESASFWNHLRAAGFIGGQTGSGTQALPQNAVGGYLGVQTGAAMGMGTLVICSANIPGKLASALDVQMDDGNPDTGRVRATAIAAPNALPAATASTAATRYADDDGTPYVVCKSL